MDKKMFVMVVNTVTNASLSLFKIIIGYLFHSSLLIADGLHSASDLLTDLFAIIGLRFASKPQDEEHPYGHGSLEYASSLTVSIIIFGMSCQLLMELIEEWSIPTSHVSMVVLGASFIAFIVKWILSAYVLYQAKKLDSHTLLSSGIESKADAYSTIIVIAGLLITHIGILYNIPLLVYAEKIATLFVVMMLFKAALTIYLASARGIAGGVATDDIKQEYLKQVMECDPDLHISHFDVLKQGIHYNVHLHVIFESSLPIQVASQRIQRVQDHLYKDSRIVHVTSEFTTTDSQES